MPDTGTRGPDREPNMQESPEQVNKTCLRRSPVPVRPQSRTEPPMNMRPGDVPPGEHEECDSLTCDRELTNGGTPESRSHYSSSKTERFYVQGVGQPATDRSRGGHPPAVSGPAQPPTAPETEQEPPYPPDLLRSEPLPNARSAPVLPTAPSESGVRQIGSLQTPVTPLIPGVSQPPTGPVLTHGEDCDNSDDDNDSSDSEQDESGAIRNGYQFVVRGVTTVIWVH